MTVLIDMTMTWNMTWKEKTDSNGFSVYDTWNFLLQKYSTGHRHCSEREIPSLTFTCTLGHTEVFLTLFLDNKTSAPDGFSGCVCLSLARILRQVQWWSVSIVMRYDVISRRYVVKPFLSENACFLNFNNKSKDLDKMMQNPNSRVILHVNHKNYHFLWS